jgi:hypothetical protein
VSVGAEVATCGVYSIGELCGDCEWLRVAAVKQKAREMITAWTIAELTEVLIAYNTSFVCTDSTGEQDKQNILHLELLLVCLKCKIAAKLLWGADLFGMTLFAHMYQSNVLFDYCYCKPKWETYNFRVVCFWYFKFFHTIVILLQ